MGPYRLQTAAKVEITGTFVDRARAEHQAQALAESLGAPVQVLDADNKIQFCTGCNQLAADDLENLPCEVDESVAPEMTPLPFEGGEA